MDIVFLVPFIVVFVVIVVCCDNCIFYLFEEERGA